ncbi:hypothetical protein QAD02_020148 [Eretmocerus hayati]|uniref:Uncharacterized protein n=1 Tax=Eretmocerus hayati TaxID=131215 RepID=A0ACC2PNH1_9HYME|nr:hypothetical protein QAD02_020148 [Eretmocerus hayati]
MFKYITLTLLIASAFALPTAEDQLDCLKQNEDTFNCMAVKAVSALNRAARSADVSIFEGVTFVRDTPMERDSRSLKSETELLKELPRGVSDKSQQIAEMFYEAAHSFLKSHSLKVELPEGSMSRALDEGRAKLKKIALPLIAAAGLKIFALAPILLGALALLVVKALVVGKIAFIIAAILAFQRLFSGGSPGFVSNFGNGLGGAFGGNLFGKNPQGWYDSSSSGWSGSAANQGQGYYRSFNDKTDAQSLAYAAQAPSTNEAN